MNEPKMLTRPAADQERDREHRPTGKVELRAFPAWLKNPPYARALLTPAEARGLAVDLLVAAEYAEKRA